MFVWIHTIEYILILILQKKNKNVSFDIKSLILCQSYFPWPDNPLTF